MNEENLSLPGPTAPIPGAPEKSCALLTELPFWKRSLQAGAANEWPSAGGKGLVARSPKGPSLIHFSAIGNLHTSGNSSQHLWGLFLLRL